MYIVKAFDCNLYGHVLKKASNLLTFLGQDGGKKEDQKEVIAVASFPKVAGDLKTNEDRCQMLSVWCSSGKHPCLVFSARSFAGELPQ